MNYQPSKVNGGGGYAGAAASNNAGAASSPSVGNQQSQLSSAAAAANLMSAYGHPFLTGVVPGAGLVRPMLAGAHSIAAAGLATSSPQVSVAGAKSPTVVPQPGCYTSIFSRGVANNSVNSTVMPAGGGPPIVGAMGLTTGCAAAKSPAAVQAATTAKADEVIEEYRRNRVFGIDWNLVPRSSLKVEDALSYLDQVKVQFAHRPQVYSDFLDIMKEFKSQVIDTPGVIQRVSRLFRGRPNLIVGFNTFLPLGYKVEVEGDRVTVFTPNGESRVINNSENGSNDITLGNQKPSPMLVGGAPSSVMEIATAPGAATQMRPQIEFNHAISYVNKIKSRFLHKPEVYKAFLEILHSYQKEQKEHKSGQRAQLTETEVYQSVAKLFENEPDLLKEFSQFLPDVANAGAAGVFGVHSPAMGARSAIYPASNSASAVCQMVNQMQHHTPTLTIKEEPEIPQQQHHYQHVLPSAMLAPPPTGGVMQQQQRMVSGGSPMVMSASPKPPSAAVTPKRRLSASPAGRNDAAPAAALSAVPTTSAVAPPPKKMAKVDEAIMMDIDVMEAAKFGTIEEFQFFDKVKKALKSEQVYDNFLRCLVLYSNDLISKTELIDIVFPFLRRHSELLKWLKDFLGCNDRAGFVDVVTQKMDQEERISSDLAMEIDYATCRRHGISYRALPDSYARPRCSGRSELCAEVLNETWVSFPSWSSEDSCVSFKKTQYEELIYRSEDERFELTIVIEVNLMALEALEAVQRRLSRMRSDEAKRFRLDDKLGARSSSLMLRALRRVYGDKTDDIVDGLKRNPAVAVPLVLNRLKAKDVEWRDAQKSFNRIWREQQEKYYLKSLDHQGINFKQTDVKHLRSKTLLNQIEVIYDERKEKEEEGVTVEGGSHMELTYSSDRDIIYDAADLIIHHVKRQSGMQKEEKSKIKRIVRQLIPEMFALNEEELSDDECDGGHSATDEGGQSGDDTSKKLRRSNRTLSALTANGVAVSNSRSRLQTKGPTSVGYSLIFTSNPWYVFFRLHHLLCDRLALLKRRAADLGPVDATAVPSSSSAKGSSTCSVAETLKFTKQSSKDEDAVAANGGGDPYSVLISQVKNLLDGQTDSNQYEDSLRSIFTVNAYIAFTMDKIVQAIVKQLQTMASSDELSTSVLALYDKHRAATSGTTLANDSDDGHYEKLAAYQADAEQLLIDQNCFKIVLQHETLRLSFELLDTDSGDAEEEECKTPPTADVEPPPTNSVQMAAYLKHFVDADTTVNRNRLAAKPVFLTRNVCRTKAQAMVADDDVPVSFVRNGAEVVVDRRSWRLRFVADTGDLYCKWGAPQKAKLRHKEVCERRRRRYEHWCASVTTVDDDSKTAFSSWLRCHGEFSSHPTKFRPSHDLDYLTSVRYVTAVGSSNGS